MYNIKEKEQLIYLHWPRWLRKKNNCQNGSHYI